MSATQFVVRLVKSEGGDVADTEFLITGRSAIVGRDAECAVPLTHDASVSRRHARIEWTAGEVFRIVDLDSVNGVWVGERRVSDERLKSGETFRIGACWLECQPAAEDESIEIQTIAIPISNTA